MTKYHFTIFPTLGGQRGKSSYLRSSKRSFFIDDHELLIRLIPASTNVKRDYKAALNKALIDEATRVTMLEIMRIAYERCTAISHGLDGLYPRIFIFCHRPRGQNVMQALGEFFTEMFPHYARVFANAREEGHNPSGPPSWLEHAVEIDPF